MANACFYTLKPLNMQIILLFVLLANTYSSLRILLNCYFFCQVFFELDLTHTFPEAVIFSVFKSCVGTP